MILPPKIAWYNHKMKINWILIVILAFVGCSSSNSPVNCTQEARSSVVLKIIDEDTGQVLPQAWVAFSVDGEPQETIHCDNDSQGLGYCGALVLAYEVDGIFEMIVSSTGYTDATRTVTISKDECHVIGQNLTIAMTSL